jgi:predicted RNA-binding Zn-ribbon protein involved in translation (DUF1610 family)
MGRASRVRTDPARNLSVFAVLSSPRTVSFLQRQYLRRNWPRICKCVMKKCPYCGREDASEPEHCRECGTKISDEEAKPDITCPGCGESVKLEPLISRHGNFSWRLFFFCGILSVLFLNASRSRRYHCQNCDSSFAARTPLAKTMLVVLIVWIGLMWLPFLLCIAVDLFSRGP